MLFALKLLNKKMLVGNFGCRIISYSLVWLEGSFTRLVRDKRQLYFIYVILL